MISAGYSCTIATGATASVCSLTCGNNVLNGAEQCDLGALNEASTVSIHGCTTSCLIEPGFYCPNPIVSCSTVCGDGIQAGTEVCDDGNTISGDGCDSTCNVEAGMECWGNGAVTT